MTQNIRSAKFIVNLVAACGFDLTYGKHILLTNVLGIIQNIRSVVCIIIVNEIFEKDISLKHYKRNIKRFYPIKKTSETFVGWMDRICNR